MATTAQAAVIIAVSAPVSACTAALKAAMSMEADMKPWPPQVMRPCR